MKDYDYRDDLSGLSDYLGAFGLGAPPVPMNLNIPTPKTTAKPVAKAPVKAAPKKVAAKPASKKPAAKAPAKTAVKATAKPVAAPKAVTPGNTGLVKTTVKKAQEILNNLGAKLKADGLFGPGTAKAWATAATAKKVDTTFKRISGTEVFVDPKTLTTLSAATPAKAAAKSAPAKSVTPAKAVATKATEPSKTGLIKTTVKNVQEILNRLGGKLKVDGLFGPGTAKAWATAAKAKKYDGTFDRASSTEAWVDPAAFASLSSTLPKATTKVSLAPATKSSGSLATKASEPSKTGLTKISIGAAQDILNKLGAKIKRDGLFGPTTAKAWGTAAKAKKTDAVFDRAGPMEAWVDPKALAALSSKAGVSAQAAASEEVAPASAEPTTPAPPAPEPAPAAEEFAAQQLIKQTTVAVPILMVQQAELMANKTPAQAGRYIGVEETGEWDDATERGFYILFSIKAPYDGIWKIALPQLVDGSSVKLLPKQASDVQSLAKLWLDNKAKEEAAANAPPAPPEPTPEVEKPAEAFNTQRVNEVVGRSTVILPVKVLQQALRQLFDLQQEGKIPSSPAIPLPQITGSWRQGSDDVGLLLGWGDKLYPYGVNVPPEDKEAILSQIVFVSPTLNGLRGFGGLRFRNLSGLRGFGAVTDGNAIKLPPEIIANIQSLASDYVAKTAQSQPQSDSSQVLLPTQGGQVALEPELITGRAPTIGQSQPVYAPPVQAPMPYQDQIQAPAPISLTPNFPDVTNNSYFTPAPAPVAAPAVAPTFEPSTSTSLTIPVATNLTIGPTIAPPPVAAPAPAEESSSIGLILGILGVGAIAVLALKGKDERKAFKAPKRKKGQNDVRT